MRITRNTEAELRISVFSRRLFFLLLFVVVLLVFAAFRSVSQEPAYLFYVMLVLTAAALVFFAVVVASASQTTFNRNKDQITIKKGAFLFARRRVLPLSTFRYARVHTLVDDNLLWEIVLVFDVGILADPDMFDADSLARQQEEAAEADRPAHEISMAAGGDTIFSFKRQQEIVTKINAWFGVDPNLVDP